MGISHAAAGGLANKVGVTNLATGLALGSLGSWSHPRPFFLDPMIITIIITAAQPAALLPSVLKSAGSVQGGDGLAVAELAEGDGVADGFFQGFLNHRAEFLKEIKRHALHASLAAQAANGTLGSKTVNILGGHCCF